MGRIRYTRAEAEAEAIRRAEAFVAGFPDPASWQLLRATPNSMVLRSSASKHPLAWVVMFRHVVFAEVMDGGELFVAVDLEANTVGLFGW